MRYSDPHVASLAVATLSALPLLQKLVIWASLPLFRLDLPVSLAPDTQRRSVQLVYLLHLPRSSLSLSLSLPLVLVHFSLDLLCASLHAPGCFLLQSRLSPLPRWFLPCKLLHEGQWGSFGFQGHKYSLGNLQLPHACAHLLFWCTVSFFEVVPLALQAVVEVRLTGLHWSAALLLSCQGIPLNWSHPVGSHLSAFGIRRNPTPRLNQHQGSCASMMPRVSSLFQDTCSFPYFPEVESLSPKAMVEFRQCFPLRRTSGVLPSVPFLYLFNRSAACRGNQASIGSSSGRTPCLLSLPRLTSKLGSAFSLRGLHFQPKRSLGGLLMETLQALTRWRLLWPLPLSMPWWSVLRPT